MSPRSVQNGTTAAGLVRCLWTSTSLLWTSLTPSPSAYVDHDDKSWWYDQACMSEGETESNDAKSQTGSDDGQALDECQDNTRTDKKWEGPDYDEDLNNPETSENEKGIRGGSRADALKRLRACSRRLVCRATSGTRD
ncbi:hypothetical protein PHLCEN_2v7419 [Hermanssonia centrifuga]|uniref:Uncharacterized protein n=1 Tax=Hermanssonia centrifuga TaxID=98765 RepID=A0A2R6NWJ9_9APHY|nr:hypothetical protein PHLCEN_2v7419 [Hermanssonia centrifuga]